jgi:threonylcarbamoyladenosine tRNA methylthiotransferase MtaB
MISRPPELIMKEAENLIARGFKEIVLTGVRLGRYEWSLARLINALLELPGDFRVRLSSIEVTEIPDEVIHLAAAHPKLCPFFHIPLQSGDDEVLKRMGRWYSASQYRAKIHEIKQLIPDAALSTDVIIGFAGETNGSFQKTIQLLQTEGFSRVHAFRYSIRPDTPAERLPNQVDPRIKSVRTREMVKVDAGLRRRYAERFLGKPLRVLVEKDGSGYTDRYVRVRVKRSILEGQFHTVTPAQSTPDAVLVA